MSKFKLYERVYLPDTGYGEITKIRLDSSGDPIYTVALDDQATTPDGIMYCRDCEIQGLS